jgi:hypothetical protein
LPIAHRGKTPETVSGAIMKGMRKPRLKTPDFSVSYLPRASFQIKIASISSYMHRPKAIPPHISSLLYTITITITKPLYNEPRL